MKSNTINEKNYCIKQNSYTQNDPLSYKLTITVENI